MNIKNEIPSSSLSHSLYHQSSAVAYAPIMPITTPTLHMTLILYLNLIIFKIFRTSLHVTTPLQPYLLHPSPHHHGIVHSGCSIPNSHHSTTSTGQQQILPLCQMPPIDSVFYGNHHQGIIDNTRRLLIEDLCQSPFHEQFNN